MTRQVHDLLHVHFYAVQLNFAAGAHALLLISAWQKVPTCLPDFLCLYVFPKHAQVDVATVV